MNHIPNPFVGQIHGSEAHSALRTERRIGPFEVGEARRRRRGGPVWLPRGIAEDSGAGGPGLCRNRAVGSLAGAWLRERRGTRLGRGPTEQPEIRGTCGVRARPPCQCLAPRTPYRGIHFARSRRGARAGPHPLAGPRFERAGTRTGRGAYRIVLPLAWDHSQRART
ncbi:hypothetical protein NDU88_003509 [Pleurodeles waltl]|uniref:Uncharacterized protein n=1 Tax=Pleurodeles waltl TaxID=8319 RepID=A0AAV7UGD3_PLEWA|nr:hypothetical protein NDU88_003509 [Pleurodeles waltl]